MIFSNISAVILAGGTNSRFGGNIKSKYIIDGKPIISRIINTLSELFSEIIIVTNTPEEFMEYKRYQIVSDHFKMVGPLGGIHAAMKVSSKESLFVFAGDMPLLNINIIRKQAEFFQACSCDVLIPSVGTNIEPLHAIYKVSVMKRVEDYLSGGNNYAIRDFYRLVDSMYFDIDDSEETRSAFANINSPSDIPSVEEKLRKRNYS